MRLGFGYDCMKQRSRILVAGIGGASLGAEVFKCLRRAEAYTIFGCDISELAFGHFMEGFEKTFRVRRDHYIEDILALCRENHIQALVPGGEEPMVLISESADKFAAIHVKIACNSPDVVAVCSNKAFLFDRLKDKGIPIPQTVTVHDASVLSGTSFPVPCVVKPAEGTGGSALVFLAGTREEAIVYAEFILRQRSTVLFQEYLPEDEGEYTVGVLSYPSGRHVGTIAMRRWFHTKLSVATRTRYGLISSGYSQGLIDEFPEVCRQATGIADILGNAGPMNIQGRFVKGRFYPFEINPRFSASTYLRAMAGYNEIHLFLQYLLFDTVVPPSPIRYGYYLRSFDEVAVPKEDVPT